MNDTFDKFTERALKVLSLAQEEAQRFNHNYIGTEHLLLGLVREGSGFAREGGVAATALKRLGVKLNEVRSAVEFIIGRGDRVVLGEIGLTPRAKKVIELAVDEARRLGHTYLGTEHLLLGLMREGEGIAAGVLTSLGVNLERLRSITQQILNGTDPWSRFEKLPWSSNEKFEVFTDSAREAIYMAKEEARTFWHTKLRPEHLLLGLICQRTGLAARVLDDLGISRRAVEDAIEPDIDVVGGHRALPGEMPLDEETQSVLELAFDFPANRVDAWEALQVSTGHILLALIDRWDRMMPSVLQMLQDQGASSDQLRLATLREFRWVMMAENDGERRLIVSSSPQQYKRVGPPIKEPKIFISYNHRDDAWCNVFAQELGVAGYDVWYDNRLHGGEEWVKELELQVNMRKVFILLLSPEALSSYWVGIELSFALRMKRRILPVHIRKTDVQKSILANWQLVDALHLDAAAAAQVVIGALRSARRASASARRKESLAQEE